jgi:hypothetical protein
MSRRRPPDWLLGVMLIIGLYLWQRTAFPAWMVDLLPNQIGAYYFGTGQYDRMYVQITDPEEWRAVTEPIAQKLQNEGELSAFLYPPIVAAVLVPFADVPAPTWRDVLFGLNVLLLFVIAYQIVRLCDAGITWRGYLWAFALVLWAYPMSRAMKLGQIVPLLAVLSWAGLLSWRRRHETSGGVVAGIVSALKIFPFALIVLPVLDRRWKGVLSQVLTIVVVFAGSLIALGATVHGYWWNSMRAFGSLTNPFFGNQAPSGWITRLAYRHPLIDEIPFTDPVLASVGFLIAAGVGTVTLLALWRHRGTLLSEHLPVSAGLVLSAVMLAIPTAWEHYWLFVLPSLGWALYETWQNGDERFWELWLALAAFLFIMKLTHFYGESIAGRIASGSQTVGMILFWIWCVRRVFLPLVPEPAHAA